MVDKAWLKNIYLEYQNLVYSVAVSIIRDGQLAEDIMQEVFVTLYFKYDTIRDQSKIKPWLIRITVNRTLDFTRKLKRSVILPEDYFERLEDTSITDPTSEMAEKELTLEIRKAIDKLPEDLKALVVLSYFLEIPLKEIAASLELPLGTVKTRLRRARFILKEHLLGQQTTANLFPDQGVSHYE